MRRICLCLMFLSVLAVAARAAPPNIVFFLIDDLGWADVGYHGSPFPTPNIDRLARAGVELDQHYVAPVCSPTRSALMTGRYWSRFGVTTPQNEQALPFGTQTLASALKSVGYTTAITGKWHLGSLSEWGPRKFGFDWSYGSLAGGTGPYDHRYKTGPFSRTWRRNWELIEEEGHVTDLIQAEAVKVIRNHDKAKPLFLYIPFTAVHTPIQEPEEWMRRVPEAVPLERRGYAACVMHMDSAVGAIYAALKAAGLSDDTMIVFSSDNGGSSGPAGSSDEDTGKYPGSYRKGIVLGQNQPLRGKKGEVYEGGIRVPAFVYYAGKLPKGKAPSPIHIVDWMPTLTRLAGYRPKKDLRWDGRDVWALLEEQSSAPERTLYWKGPQGRSSAVRQGDWKLIVHQREGGPGKTELFHLGRDPYETTDLSGKESAVADRLKAELARLQAGDDDAVAGPLTSSK